MLSSFSYLPANHNQAFSKLTTLQLSLCYHSHPPFHGPKWFKFSQTHSEIRTPWPRDQTDPVAPLHSFICVCFASPRQPGDRQEFSVVARKRIMEVVNAAHMRQRLLNRPEDSEDEGLSEGEEDTWVFPLVQMKPLGIQVDEQVTQVRLHTWPCDDSGFFWLAVSLSNPQCLKLIF